MTNYIKLKDNYLTDIIQSKNNKNKNLFIVSHKINIDNFTCGLILNKYYELYDISEVDDFLQSYFVYINNKYFNRIYDIKHEYNLIKHNNIKNVNDAYNLISKILNKFSKYVLK